MRYSAAVDTIKVTRRPEPTTTADVAICQRCGIERKTKSSRLSPYCGACKKPARNDGWMDDDE